MWTCSKCGSKWNRNKLRCCNRKQPKRRPSHKDLLNDMPYEDWVVRYGETCGICGASPPEGRRLYRDHDHRSGLARGLLCFPCNRALPYYVDGGWLLRAAAYVDGGGG